MTINEAYTKADEINAIINKHIPENKQLRVMQRLSVRNILTFTRTIRTHLDAVDLYIKDALNDKL